MMFLAKFKKNIFRYDLLRKNDRIIVGVSGGPDSVALLKALSLLRDELRISLYVAHFNHGLRKASQKDAEFVANLTRKMELPFISEKADYSRIPKKTSLEEKARELRFDFFFRTAAEIKATKVALGHNQDDQAETLLMRIIRGSGLVGLSGIIPKRFFADVCLIRPLLNISRFEIIAFLKENNLKFRIDETNQEDIFLRNRLRNKLIPLLEKQYNPRIKSILANLGQTSAIDYDYIENSAKKTAKHLSNSIPVATLLKLHPSLMRVVVRLKIAGLKGNNRSIYFSHITEIEDLVHNRPNNSIVDLPGSICVHKQNKKIIFYKRGK